MEEETCFCKNCKRSISASNFATHSAYCERNIKVCKLCNEPVPILEEDSHFSELHIDVQCDQCHFTLQKWRLPEHLASCRMRPVTCKFCDGEFPFAEFSEHYDFCSSRTEKCLVCKKYVMLKEKEEHSEMHRSEEKNRHENIVNEIEQNIINEELGTFTASRSNIQTEVDESKNLPSCSNRVMIEETDDTNLGGLGATANVYENSKQMNKYYGTCYICKQSIPWLDMNTHIPGCATYFGKCSQCGEDVSEHEMKDHVLKNCRLLSRKGSSSHKGVSKKGVTNREENDYFAQEDLEDHTVACQYCKQECSEDRIEEHTRNCPENSSYECPFCSKSIAEKDKIKHESFECDMLLDNKPHSSRTSSNILKRAPIKTKPQNSSEISTRSKSKVPLQKRKLELEITKDHYPRLNRNKSYADSARTSQETYKSFYESETCPLCYKKISQNSIQDHLLQCRELQQNECLYCEEIIFTVEEDAHLSMCKAFNSKSGAVPKCSMVQLETAKCNFCQTKLSLDMISFHKERCKYLVKCEKCGVSILRTQFKHTCVSRKEEKKVKQDKNEGLFASIGGIGKSFWSVFSASPVNEEENSNARNMEYSSDASTSHDYDNQFSHLHTEEIQIPCEFCSKLFAASDIVLHETGCQPDLVSFAKKDSQEERESKVPFFPSPSNKCSKVTSSEKKFLSVERTKIPSTKRNSKMDTESDIKPGEFLKSLYITKTSSSSKTETDEEYNPNEFGENISNSPEILSVWNVSIAGDGNKVKEEISDEHQLVKEDTVNSDEEMAEMLEFINEGNTASDNNEKKINSEEIEEGTSHLTLDHDFYSQKCNTDIPEAKNSLNDTKSTYQSYKEALKAFKEVNDALDEIVRKVPSTYFASEEETDVQCQKRLTIEPDEDILREKIFLTADENLHHYAENKDDDTLMQCQENDCENTEVNL